MASKRKPVHDPDADDPKDDDAILVEARDRYKKCAEYWNDNFDEAKDDLHFAELDEQWPDYAKKDRTGPSGVQVRPMLTFNRLRPIVRQVVNDSRQNKPQIHVHPQDSKADPQVAQIIEGIIRNIETSSDADIAYDTAIGHSVGRGFGYWRINTAYTCDDVFEQDIVYERIANPFTVYGDPHSTAADSSDWNVAFITTTMSKDEFEDAYPDAEKVDWEHDFTDCNDWLSGDEVVVAEYWTREKVTSQIVMLSDGSVVKASVLEEQAESLAEAGLMPVGKPRDVESYKVTQRIMSGAEILKTVEWAGKYIPIVPVYGDEVIDEDGKRHFWSLIRGSKSAQQQFNFWETTSTELVALAPKAPWVGEERSFKIDPNWDTANQISHSKLVVPDGAPYPQRQPFAGLPAGALQEALRASDNIKATSGIYDASLGARTNEISGRAIRARQMEGDVSTFHFLDNLSRSVRHSARIILDLIPHVYSTARILRALGEDMKPYLISIAPSGQPVTPVPAPQPQPGQQMNGQGQTPPQQSLLGHIYDITIGKYDVVVAAGPSYTTRREEMMEIMTEAAQAGGERVAMVLAPRIAKLLEVPDADEIADELKAAFAPPAAPQGIPPEQVQMLGQKLQQTSQQLQQLALENQQLKMKLLDKQQENALKAQANQTDAFEAQTNRLEAMKPEFVRPFPTAPTSFPPSR